MEGCLDELPRMGEGPPGREPQHVHKISGLVFGRVSPASVGPELNGPNQQTRCSVQHQGSECPPLPISAQTLLAINRVYLLEAALDTGQAGGSAHGTRDPRWPL